MVFLSKTRERGIKALNKEKKKLQKLVEKKSPEDKQQEQTPQPTQVRQPSQPQPQQQQQPPPPSSLSVNPVNSTTTTAPIHVKLPFSLGTKPSPSPSPSPSHNSGGLGSGLGQGVPGGANWWVSDVTFMVEERKIPCHKVVLQSRSEYFTELFSSSNPSNSSNEPFVLSITNYSHHIFSLFVRWVYGGKKDIAPEDLLDLLRCAKEFRAPELISLCERLMEEHNIAQPPKQDDQEQGEESNQMQDVSFNDSFSLSLNLSDENLPQQNSPSAQNLQNLHSYPESEEIQFFSSSPPNPSSLSFLSQLPSQEMEAMEHYPTLGQAEAMNLWSNDPLLYSSDRNDAGDVFRSMEMS